MRTVEDLVLTYYSSNDFSMLRDKSKKDYQYFLNILVGEFGNIEYDKLSSKQAKHAYEEWVKRGITFANHVCTVSSLAVSLRHRHGVCAGQSVCQHQT